MSRRPNAPNPNASLRRPSAYFDPDTNIGLDARPGGPPMPYNPSSQPTSRNPSRPRNPPQPTQNQNPYPADPLPVPRPRPREKEKEPQARARGPPSASERKSKVGAALLQKRQSVAYGNGPVERGPAPPMPGMPSGGGREGRGGGERRVARGPGGMDMGALAQEGFDPDQFLMNNLGTTETNALKAFKTNLITAQSATNQDLQQGVYKNYSAFIAISKEIATLESEMLELKTVLEEFKTVPASLDMGAGYEDASMSGGSLTNDIRRRTARNSIADVNALYKAQLEALWDSVEGAQKFLPAISGRHLQAESTTFVELHPATYRPRQNVHLFLLNDALLVAVRKRAAMGGGKVKLMAEKCFALNEIAVIDLKDGGDLNNAIKIKRGRDTNIFRTDRMEDKKALLSAFKKVAEEMANKKRKQNIWEAEHRQTGGRREGMDGLPPMPTGASAVAAQYDSDFSPSKILGLGSKDDANGKDLSWIGDFADELAVSIALRTYELAVVLVEKAKSILPKLAGDPVGSSMLRQKLDVRSAELVAALLQDLGDAAIKKSGVVACAGWLLRLGSGAGERAREGFLEMRSKLVRKRCRLIKFEGDISLWVGELAMVVFTLIKNTCEWYMSAFHDYRMASGFVRWASQQIEFYAEMFRRQVYGANQDSRVVQESLAVTRAHSTMLKDYGLDFGFLLNSLLQPEAQIRRSRSTGAVRANGEDGGTMSRRRSFER